MEMGVGGLTATTDVDDHAAVEDGAATEGLGRGD